MRRIEGVLLAPIQDNRGIHRFHADDVEALMRDIVQGDVSIWREMSDATDRSRSRLVARNQESARRHHHVPDAPAAKASSERGAKLERENRELLAFARELAGLLVEVLSPSQLRTLPHKTLAVLMTLLDEAE